MTNIVTAYVGPINNRKVIYAGISPSDAGSVVFDADGSLKESSLKGYKDSRSKDFNASSPTQDVDEVTRSSVYSASNIALQLKNDTDFLATGADVAAKLQALKTELDKTPVNADHVKKAKTELNALWNVFKNGKDDVLDVKAESKELLDSDAKKQQAYKRGLIVLSTSKDSKNDIAGQESDVNDIRVDADGVIKEVRYSGHSKTALKDDTRIFGALSNSHDIPKEIFIGNQYVKNTGYAAGTATTNSWRYDYDTRVALLNKEKQAKTETYDKFNERNRRYLAPTEQHLDYVQYGRVTTAVDIDHIKNVLENDQNSRYYRFETTNKFRFDNNDVDQKLSDVLKRNNTIDFYFARGVNTTTEMPKSGKYQYLGHALMHGLDNSLHSLKDNNNSNAAILYDRSGTGNYVSAQLDMDKKLLTGEIYNIWTKDHNNVQSAGLIKDVLVDFKGNVNTETNSVIGDATRRYVANDTAASFKGGFFGKNAEELVGNINSTTTGYGDTKWGGVFGAKQPAKVEGVDWGNLVEVPDQP